MKILMLCDFFGIDQQYQENLLTKYYKKQGHEVTIIASTFENINDYYLELYDKNVSDSKIVLDDCVIFRLPYTINFLNKIRKFSGVYEIIESVKPDVIFAHGVNFNLSDAVAYKKKYGCKIIIDSHADYSNSGKKWLSLFLLHKILRGIYLNYYKKFIDKIYGIVPDGLKFMNENYGINYKEMELLPLGSDYDLSEEIRESHNKEELRDKFNISKSDFVIITGGKLKPEKNTGVVIDAVKFINNKSIHLIVFGASDKDHTEYEEKLRTNSKDYNVHFTGWLNSRKILELMNISDIAIFPSSQSVMWQQAIGMHLPLIVGNSGSQDASYLNKNDNVIVLSKQNINSIWISKLISDLIEKPEKLIKMREGAKKTAEEFLNYDIIAKKTLE